MGVGLSHYVVDRVSRGDEWAFRASDTDVTAFTSTKALVLTGFHCTMVYEIGRGIWADITIVEVDPVKTAPKELYSTRVRLQLESIYETKVTLRKPIAIKGEVKYEIRVKVELDPKKPLEYGCSFYGHDSDIVLDNGASIRFETNHGMVDELYFERDSEFDYKLMILLPLAILALIWYFVSYYSE